MTLIDIPVLLSPLTAIVPCVYWNDNILQQVMRLNKKMHFKKSDKHLFTGTTKQESRKNICKRLYLPHPGDKAKLLESMSGFTSQKFA